MKTSKIINVKISDKIQKILDNISVQERTHEQLKNMYNNISSSTEVNDYEKEALIEVVTKKIRIDFPAKAKKMLGSKDEQARILLEEIYATLNEEFDLSNPEINDVKPGIKVGGDMISGRRYVCRYFSFKTKISIEFLLDCLSSIMLFTLPVSSISLRCLLANLFSFPFFSEKYKLQNSFGLIFNSDFDDLMLEISSIRVLMSV